MNTQYSGGGSKPPVVINNVALRPIELNGERVVTLAMIDKVHGRPDGTARRNFNANKERLVLDKHYARMSADEFRSRFPGQVSGRATEDVTLMTERGYLKLVKSFNDDLAWDVQDMLVDSYFVKANAGIASMSPNPAAIRECRLAHAMNMKLLGMLGIRGNQAVLAASRGTKAMTGIDPLELMGVTYGEAPRNEPLLAPSDVAERVGMKSGQAINKRLIELGLQVLHRDHRDRVYYEPTDEGIIAGAIMVDTGKKHGDGAPVRQLRWSASIIRYLEDANGSHH